MDFVFWTNFAKRSVVGIVLVNLGACAAVVSGNDTITTVDSNPSPADCLVSGSEYKTTITTPRALEIPTSAAPLTITCDKAGYFETKILVSSEANPWILGNAIIGGGIGLIIDLASGSGIKLPPQVTVQLDPSVFPSAAARDAYFAERMMVEEQIWKKTFGKYFNSQERYIDGRECGPTAQSTGDCEPQKNEDLIKARDESIQRIRWMSENSAIGNMNEVIKAENEAKAQVVAKAKAKNSSVPEVESKPVHEALAELNGSSVDYTPMRLGAALSINDNWYSVKSTSEYKAVLRSARGNDFITFYGWFAQEGDDVLDHPSIVPYPWSYELDNPAREAMRRFWPLKIGNQATFERESTAVGVSPYRYSWRLWYTTLKVTGTEMVDYEGKDVPAFVIDEVTESPSKQTQGADLRALKLQRKHYYAPSVGGVVRTTATWSVNGRKHSSSETEFKYSIPAS